MKQNIGWKRFSRLALSLLAGAAFATACASSDEAVFAGGAGASSGAGAGSPTCSVNAGQQCPVVCDPALGCVDCLVNSDCGLAKPVCVVGKCEECGDNNDCPIGQSCFPKDHVCELACVSNQDCKNGNAPLCDPVTKACVGCATAKDCPVDKPICATTNQQCVACGANSDCGVAKPVCDIADGDCVECLTDTQCPTASPSCVDKHCTNTTPLTCGAGEVDCGGTCKAVATDPNNCGGCNMQCQELQFCTSGKCACKPGLTFANGQCRDFKSDPNHCGSMNNQCQNNTDKCDNGMCVGNCNLPDECNGACVDQETDPLHCGQCDKICDQEEVCVKGQCRNWIVAAGCSTCPCQSACVGDFKSCCSYPNQPSLTICVDNDQCP
ncbi:MAG: hypothetical protein EXR75_07225 [Myxococcales bacterium]|nr:hypothetical protein [Myxococcales bacterium]